MSTVIDKTESSLQLSRLFKAPRERVFAAWTDPAQIQQWWGCKDSHDVVSEVDLRVGGRYCHKYQTTSYGAARMTGEYREIVEPEKLVFTLDFEGNEAFQGMESFLITIELFDRGDGFTELRLTHEGLMTGEMREGVTGGWGDSFNKLEKFLA